MYDEKQKASVTSADAGVEKALYPNDTKKNGFCQGFCQGKPDDIFEVHLDSMHYTSKPREFNDLSKALRCEGTVRRVTLPGLRTAILQGRSFCPGVLRGGSAEGNWTNQRVFAIDIDNGAKLQPRLTPKDVEKLFTGFDIPISFCYKSFSYKFDFEKFRVVFACEETITDPNIAKKIVSAFIDCFPVTWEQKIKKTGEPILSRETSEPMFENVRQSDMSCRDLNRLFLGTSKGLVDGIGDINARFSVKAALDLYDRFHTPIERPEPPPIKKNSLSYLGQFDLKKAIGEFNLLEFMESFLPSTTKRTHRSKGVCFNPCPVCGSDTGFNVNHKWYHCFSDHHPGFNGGNIITFLRNLYGDDLQEAYKRFKVELCGVDEIAEKEAWKKAQIEALPKNKKTKNESAEDEVMKVNDTANAENLYSDPTKPLKSNVLQMVAPSGNAKVAKRKVTFLSEIEPEEQQFLVYPYIPAGCFTIMAGDTGETKTTFCLYLASLLSQGKAFFSDELPFDYKPKKVWYQSNENDFPTAIRPRLDQMGANLDNIFTVTQGGPITFLDPSTEEILKEERPALAIFDPVQSFLGAQVDMHRANEVRPVLDHIGQLSKKYECAFIILMHLNKMISMPALERIVGSMDFKAAARSVIFIGHDPADEKRRVLAHGKASNTEKGRSIAYRITGKGVEIEGFCDLDEDEIVSRSHKKRAGKKETTVDSAMDFLIEMLGESGWAFTTAIFKEAEKQHFSKASLQRARENLNLFHDHDDGFGKRRVSWWGLSGFSQDEIRTQALSSISQAEL